MKTADAIRASENPPACSHCKSRGEACRLTGEKDSSSIRKRPTQRSRPTKAPSVREKNHRLDLLQDLSDRLRLLIEHRACAESAMDAGLVVRKVVAIGSGRHQVFEEREELNHSLVKVLIATLKQVKHELSDPKKRVDWDGDPTKLTDEQLYNMIEYFTNEPHSFEASKPASAPAALEAAKKPHCK
jgi:hypothetical protein